MQNIGAKSPEIIFKLTHWEGGKELQLICAFTVFSLFELGVIQDFLVDPGSRIHFGGRCLRVFWFHQHVSYDQAQDQCQDGREDGQQSHDCGTHTELVRFPSQTLLLRNNVLTGWRRSRVWMGAGQQTRLVFSLCTYQCFCNMGRFVWCMRSCVAAHQCWPTQSCKLKFTAFCAFTLHDAKQV